MGPRGNIPHQGRWQPLTGLDPYHRVLRETHDQPSLPYAASEHSFSVPRSPRTTVSRNNSPNLAHSDTVRSQLSPGSGTTWPGWTNVWRDQMGEHESGPVMDPVALASSVASWRKDGIFDEGLRWRPEFLRRRVLLGFAALFAVVMVAVEVVLHESQTNKGLCRGDDASARYLWQYGVTLLATILAVAWTRIEFQAKSSAPWIRMAQGPTSAEASILLDYLSIPRLKAMLNAYRSGDILVANSAGISIVLMFLVILAPALASPTTQRVTKSNGNLTLTTAFFNDAAGLQDVGSLPYTTMLAMQTTNIGLPDGVTSRFAYQTFRTDLDTSAEISALVTGFEGGLDCEPASMSLGNHALVRGSIVDLVANVTTGDCESSHIVNVTLAESDEKSESRFLALQNGSCDSSSQVNDRRIVVISGTAIVSNSVGSATPDIDVQSSLALVCQPRYTMARLQVVRNGTHLISVEKSVPESDFALPAVTAWDIAEALFSTYNNPNEGPRFSEHATSVYQSEVILSADEPMSSALMMKANNLDSPLQLNSLDSSEALLTLVQEYYAQYTAILAHNTMLRPSSAKSQADVTTIELRLTVRNVVAHTMAGLLGLCVIAIAAMTFYTPRTALLPGNPDSIMSIATILSQSHSLLESLQGLGGAGQDEIRRKLAGSTYWTEVQEHYRSKEPGASTFRICCSSKSRRGSSAGSSSPTWTQPVSLFGPIKLLFVFTLAAIIIGLEVTLRASRKGKLSGPVSNTYNDYTYLLWTMLPVLVFLPVLAYLDTLDYYTRSLSPYCNLVRGAKFGDCLGLSILNCSQGTFIWRALKRHDVRTALTALMALLSVCLSAGSASLFVALPSKMVYKVAVETHDILDSSSVSFTEDSDCIGCNSADAASVSLVVSGDNPFPSFTYKDLIFPFISSLEVDDLGEDQSLSVLVPAARPRMNCRLYNSEEISAQFTHVSTSDETRYILRTDIPGESCHHTSGTARRLAASGGQRYSIRSSMHHESVFGRATGKSGDVAQCSDWLYVWGNVASLGSNNAAAKTIAALSCNETMETVDTDVAYYGMSLRIDDADVPSPIEETARETPLSLPPLQYDTLGTASRHSMLDPFFEKLISSQHADIDKVMLGNIASDSIDQVQQAIIQQHNIIRAQTLRLNARIPISSLKTQTRHSRNTIPAAIQSGSTRDTLTGTVSADRVTLQQNVLATRILQGVLGLLLIMLCISWYICQDMLLPRQPTSIASIAAWLADGNLMGRLGAESQWQSMEELQRCFGSHRESKRYQLAWGIDAREDGSSHTGKASFGIRELPDVT